MILKSIESKLEDAITSRHGVRVIPLRQASANTNQRFGFPDAYLQVLRYPVPQVHSLPVRVIILVEGTARGVKFIRKLSTVSVLETSRQYLMRVEPTYNKTQLRTVCRGLGLGRRRRIRVHRTPSDMLQQWDGADVYTHRTRGAGPSCRIDEMSSERSEAGPCEQPRRPYGCSREHSHNWISDEEKQHPHRYEHQTADVDHAPLRKDIALPLVLLIGIWIVQPVVLLDVLRE